MEQTLSLFALVYNLRYSVYCYLATVAIHFNTPCIGFRKALDGQTTPKQHPATAINVFACVP